MTTNYLQIMIDSLKKKKDILDKIIVLNETQNKILSNKEFDHDVFENNKLKYKNYKELVCEFYFLRIDVF